MTPKSSCKGLTAARGKAQNGSHAPPFVCLFVCNGGVTYSGIYPRVTGTPLSRFGPMPHYTAFASPKCSFSFQGYTLDGMFHLGGFYEFSSRLQLGPFQDFAIYFSFKRRTLFFRATILSRFSFSLFLTSHRTVTC